MKLRLYLSGRTVGSLLMALVLTSPWLVAGEGTDTDTSTGSAREEIALLKLQLAAQQQQIDQLRRELDEQKGLLRIAIREGAPVGGTPVSGSTMEASRPMEVASLVAAVPPSPPPSGGPGISKVPVAQQATNAAEKPAATSFSLGSVHITPVGFAELVGYVRDKNSASGLGTNFASIPFSNTVNGNLSEANLTAQQSRLGVRVDAKVPGMGLMAYLETDFLGASPGNVSVTGNSNTLRIRLFWVNLTRNKFEFLTGQSWSLITPSRKGISPLPSDIFNTLGLDPNNHVGLVWGRIPQVRFVYHPNKIVSMAFSAESPSQYIGGSAGAGVITLPSALTPSYGGELNSASNPFASPSPMPDVIGKLAFDRTVGGRALHLEVSGLLRRFGVYNSLTNVSYGATGSGGSLNGNVQLTRNLRLFGSSFLSDGGGRFIFGLGPDLIVREDGSVSPVKSYSTLDGFEVLAGRHLTLYGYYGGAYIQKNTAVDPLTGKLVGYGYEGSPSNHNRAVQQVTFGMSYLFWRNPEYGGLSFNTQYSYVFRNQWAPAPGLPGEANINVVYLSMRYLLPGAPPSPK